MGRWVERQKMKNQEQKPQNVVKMNRIVTLELNE